MHNPGFHDRSSLEAFNLSEYFVQTVKALYDDAHTAVAVNGGVFSEPYRVTQGVRQGDPLSCFLFDLGIGYLLGYLRQLDPTVSDCISLHFVLGVSAYLNNT